MIIYVKCSLYLSGNTYHPKVEGGMALQNVGILPCEYTVSQPKDGDMKILQTVVFYHITIQ